MTRYRIGRRRTLLGLVAWPALVRAEDALRAIVQPAERSRAAFIARAFACRDEAVRRGDQPYGAVVVRNGAIVGEGVSAVVTARDPTAHAERVAIRDAQRRLRTHDLAGAELYGTARACAMCESAAQRASIARMYYGADGVDAGPPLARG